MDISSSTVIGTMRVGLQIISNHRHPMLEFYYEIRNMFTPETKIPIRGEGKISHELNTRFQDIFIQFTIVNIGSVRAEDIEFEISGELKRNRPIDGFGEILETTIPQIAPGQLIHLFRFDEHDLYIYPEKGGKRQGIKTDSLQIVAKYNGPNTIKNRLLSRKRLFGKKQYESKFVFKPGMVCGDLPPAEYM